MDQTNSTYYGPIGETAEDIFWEKTWMAAGYLTGVGFGIQLVVYSICIEALWNRKQKTPFMWFLMGFITLLCVLNCIFTGVNAFGLQITYIDRRNFPGGPWAYLQGAGSDAYNVISEVAYFMSNLMADSLLLWRCRVIWFACIGPKSILFMVIPFFMLLASFALAIISIDMAADPSAGFFSTVEVKLNLSSYTISLSLNIILTAMIVGQMWAARRKGQEVFGDAYGAQYGSMSAMFVESAALYSLFSIPLLVTYGMNHPTSQIWLALNPAAQVIANYLIIYRVAQGRAWTSGSLAAPYVSQPMAFDRHAWSSATQTGVNDEENAVNILLEPKEIKNDTSTNHSTVADTRGPSPVWAKRDVIAV